MTNVDTTVALPLVTEEPVLDKMPPISVLATQLDRLTATVGKLESRMDANVRHASEQITRNDRFRCRRSLPREIGRRH